jgi:hypothetical protein
VKFGGFESGSDWFFMTLDREGCMRSTQQQVGSWEPFQPILKGRGNKETLKKPT